MIDELLEQAKNEGSVDVFRCIKSLRKDRPNMVQTEVRIRDIKNSSTVYFQEVILGYQPGIQSILHILDK
jgi:protein tyrosine phosphatase